MVFTSTVDFSLFFPVWIPWDSYFRPMRHITSTHYSHNYAPPTIRSDDFSCGLPPPRASATPAAATGTAAVRAAATPGTAAIHAAATPSTEQK